MTKSKIKHRLDIAANSIKRKYKSGITKSNGIETTWGNCTQVEIEESIRNMIFMITY